jgi:hypothetical protein
MPDIYGSEIYDVPRQSSRCQILIYSHISKGTEDQTFTGAVNCSRDVIECTTSKTIKAGGGASFILVPRRNYLNYIFPNDYVYIYFDPGDGRGFILTFFGFIDRIERSVSTGGNGETTTRFTVTCSDFTKAFDKTNVYFNPHIVDRGDFASQHFAGTKNLGGSALRTKGITVYGTPADVVMSLAQRLMGFGAQFSVPASHPEVGALADASRKRRFKNLLKVLASDFQDLESPDDLLREQTEINAEMAQVMERAKSEMTTPLSEQISFIKLWRSASTGSPFSLSTSASLGDQGSLNAASALMAALGSSSSYEKINDPNVNAAIEEGQTIYGTELSLLDLIDFSFIESPAISGAILSAQIWQSQGPLWSIMNSWSNDLVNELFCDLRPLGFTETFDLRSGSYSNEPDYLYGNIGGGVQFVPAIVMREYPFSTVESVIPASSVKVLGHDLGSVPLGGYGDDGIWSKGRNEPGRQVSNISALNPFLLVEDSVAQAEKHLDVCVISVKDIINERIGRTDADVVNLIEVYADIGMGEMGKYMDNDVQPISNPISIMRDGLRVRTYTSKFARWPAEKMGSAGLDNPGSRYQTIRWALLIDHWYQHSKEYLNGTFTTRAFPEVRVGYRLDIKERAESYYVEGVGHNWTYSDKGGMLITNLTVSRGQRNDPFPVYVLPALAGWGGVNNRDDESRLAQYFVQKNPSAVTGSSVICGDSDVFTDKYLENFTDMKNKYNVWSSNTKGYLAAGATPSLSEASLGDAWDNLGETYEALKKLAKEKILDPGIKSLKSLLSTPSATKTGGGSTNG